MSRLIPLNYRSKEDRLTQKRVEMIISYVVYCYKKMIFNNTTYSKSLFFNKDKTRCNLEEGLSEKLVEDFLGNYDNKQYYKKNMSSIDFFEITFHCETKQTYTENESRKDDYIDIKVSESEISRIWGALGEKQQVHFAIECKVVESGFSEYISDIKKMCDRPFNTPRLNFEGQIAYITNPKYDHQTVRNGININLSSNSGINTIQNLIPKAIHENFDAGYLSVHKRSHNLLNFTIYHLFLNYSDIVIE